jgi:putative spermidine/putrescine transport system substrate-binding protein
MKKIVALILAISMTAVLFAGCGSKKATEQPQASKEPQTLIISNWGLGEEALLANIFKPFEEKFNAKVVLESGNNSERLTKVKNNPNSDVDIIYHAQSFAQDGFDAGLFEKIDYSKIPNVANLNEKAKNFVEEGQGPAYTVNR